MDSIFCFISAMLIAFVHTSAGFLSPETLRISKSVHRRAS